MSSSYTSAYSSSYTSQTPSRGTTPIPPVHHHHRRNNFWRGFGLGGLTTAGLIGLIKLGSFAKNYFHDKFHPKITPTPTPTPGLTLHNNRHY